MLSRPAILGLLVAALATGALADDAEPTLKDAAVCRTAPDLAECLLDMAARVSVVRNDLNPDPELRREQPALFARLHATAKPSAVAAAIDAALAADKAGRPPARALEPIDTLDDRTPPSGPFAAARSSAPRLMGYKGLWAELRNDPARPLAKAALLGWEHELGKANGRADPGLDVDALMRAYVRAGDLGGARRAMQLDAPLDSAREIRRLVIIGDLDRAALVSRNASLATVEAAVRQEYGPATEAALAMNESYTALAKEFARATAEKLRAEGHTSQADQLEQQAAANGRFISANDLGVELGAAIRDDARDRMAAARFTLFAAAAARPDIAREAADAYFAHDGSANLLGGDLRRMAKAATPAVAQQWIEAQQAEIGKAVPLEQQPITPNYLYIALTGWSALGRTDRVQALLDRWIPQAREEAAQYRADPSAMGQVAHQVADFLADEGRLAEALPLTPYVSNFLVQDINEGRGLANLDTYLAHADAQELLAQCISAGIWKRDYALVAACLGKAVARPVKPQQQIDYAHRALGAAGVAERQGQSEQALRLWEIASSIALKIDGPDMPLFIDGHALVDVAKAALRRDGRLPAHVVSQP